MTTNPLISRRHQLTEFRDLFTALFKIQDREVQTRVLDAINGIVDPSGAQCPCRKNKKFADVGVQTVAIQTFVVPKKFGLLSSVTSNGCLKKDQKTPPSSIRSESEGKSIVDALRQIRVPPDCKLQVNALKSSVISQSSARPILPGTNEAKKNQMEPQPPATLKLPVKLSSTLLPPQLNGSKLEIRHQPMPQNEDTTASNAFGEFLRKRKRTLKVPRVEKVTEPGGRLRTFMNNPRDLEYPLRGLKRGLSLSQYSKAKVMRSKSEEDDHEDILKLLDCYNKDQIDDGIKSYESPKSIVDIMKQEWMISLNAENGLYPIHNAILDNDIKQLKRQMYVLKYRNIKMHKLLTDNDETPLQLAIKNNCILPIITELLDSDADPNEADKDSNTVVHLAMMYSDNTKLLRLLLERISFDIIDLYNDNGNTALHVGVNEDKFLMCKLLLEFIDEKENIKTVGTGIDDKAKLLAVYKNELNTFPTRDVVTNNIKKMSIIDATNRKNGRTPLLSALGNRSQQSEIMVFMLLVHLADPKVPDFTGMDSVAYVLESYEGNRYCDALEIATLYLERCMKAAHRQQY